MRHFSTFLTAFCVTLVAAAALAQTAEPPITSNASRRQSGTVGPPIDAASMNASAASAPRSVSPGVTAPAATPAPARTSTQAPTQLPGQVAGQAPGQAPETAPADTSPPITTAPAESAKPGKPAAGSRASRRASGRVTEADGSSGGLPVRPDRN
jgi:hypothetical protein